jgi:hypothetical protein
MKSKRIFALLGTAVLLVAFAAVPVTAYGASAAQTGYAESGPITEVTEAASGNSASGAASGSVPSGTVESGTSSVLPFTGLELAIVLLLGVGLLGLGLLIRRASRSTSA